MTKMQHEGPRKQRKRKSSFPQILSPFDECTEKWQVKKGHFLEREIFEEKEEKHRRDQDSGG